MATLSSATSIFNVKSSVAKHGVVCSCSGCKKISASLRLSPADKSFVKGQKAFRVSNRSLAPKKRALTIVKADSSNGSPISNLLDVATVDKQKEEGMPYRRTVFSFDDWSKHRSSGRYIRHLQTIFGSRVISALWPPVVTVTGISALVTVINSLVTTHDLPDWVPLLHINPLPFSLTSSALSFLLVFRTNASYGRFDEARKMWGLMLNRTRDIARQALSYIARDEYAYEKPKLLQFIRHLQAFPLTYKHHFLLEGSLEEDLRTFTKLTDPEIKAMLASTHRPNYCLSMCSEIMRSTHVNPVARLSMDMNLTTFADDIGGCERLFKTPIPLSYTRLTSRFLILWHIFLPLGLWDSCGILTIPVTFFIASVLFCVDEVGVLIEEPFSILALAVIAQSSRNNVQELLDLHEGMAKLVVPNDPISGVAKAAISSSQSEGWEGEVGSILSTPATAVEPVVPAVGSSLSTSLPVDNGSTIRTEKPSWVK